jgi:hypothetical protein
MAGDLVHLFDLGARLLIDGDATGGSFSIVEHTLVISPGGFENYFRELAPLLGAGDEAGVQEVAARYALEIDFATIPALAERHGLRVSAPA